jgi:hypothetical protein
MLRACALQYGRSWDKSLLYAEFSYNNSYQESRKMALFEMCMDVDVGLCCFGIRLENGKFLDLTYCTKTRSKSIWLWRTYVSRNRDRRAMPTIGEEN